MVEYKCDRCGKKREKYELFTVTIIPPPIYRDDEMHFCIDCMRKIIECIDELGRNE